MIGDIPQVKGPILLFIAVFGHYQHCAKLNHSKERRAPVSKQRKIVDKPTRRLVDLIANCGRDSSNADKSIAPPLATKLPTARERRERFHRRSKAG
jgi:hypothetical protein